MKHGISRAAKRAMLAILIIIVLFGAAGYFGYDYLNKENTKKYEAKIQEANAVLAAQERTVLIVTSDIKAGDALTTENTAIQTAYSSMDSRLFATREDIGKIARINLFEGSQILISELAPKDTTSDQREVEFGCISIASNMSTNDYVDLRLRYPDGTDYVVLAKKQLIIGEGCVRFILTEEELLTIDSAIVDAYTYSSAYSSDASEGAYKPDINGILYLTKYTEPNIQAESVVNYIPSVQSAELIRTNPNILEIANRFLSETSRVKKEAELVNYRLNKETVENLEGPVSEDEYNGLLQHYVEPQPEEDALGNVDNIIGSNNGNNQ